MSQSRSALLLTLNPSTCRSFHRSFSVSFYILAQACVSSALQQLADLITDTEQQHSDSLSIILVDLHNHQHPQQTHSSPPALRVCEENVSEDKESRRSRRCFTNLSKKCKLSSWLSFSHRSFNKSLELCEVPSCLKRHQPHPPKEKQKHKT